MSATTESQFTAFLFHASSYAFRAEKLLEKAGIPCKMMPVPRHLSSDCGVCLRIDSQQSESAIRALAEGKMEVAATHIL